jgi:hypothetical protein
MSAAPTAPGVQAPAALAAVLQAPDPTKPPDAFVQADTIDLPETSGFADAPVIAALPAIATEGAAADIRPAAFNPSTALPLPGAPLRTSMPPPNSARSACPAAWMSAPRPPMRR